MLSLRPEIERKNKLLANCTDRKKTRFESLGFEKSREEIDPEVQAKNETL
jgi:hypothetical protein